MEDLHKFKWHWIKKFFPNKVDRSPLIRGYCIPGGARTGCKCQNVATYLTCDTDHNFKQRKGESIRGSVTALRERPHRSWQGDHLAMAQRNLAGPFSAEGDHVRQTMYGVTGH